MKKMHWMTIILLLAVTALAGCSGTTDKTASNDPSAAPQADIPQEITANLAGGEPYTLDPAFASDTTSYFVIDNLYEGLYTYDKAGKIVEGAASKVNVSPDGKTYTFTIRDGAKWSNGDPLTAKDFEYS